MRRALLRAGAVAAAAACAISSPPARAACGPGEVHIAGELDRVGPLGPIVVEATGVEADELERVRDEDVWLESNEGRVALHVDARFRSPARAAQVVLRPSRSLAVGSSWRLHVRANELGTVVVAEPSPVDAAPWQGPPLHVRNRAVWILSGTREELGCGPRIDVSVSLPLARRSVSWVEAMVEEEEPGAGVARWLYAPTEGRLSLGRRMCGGAFDFEPYRRYRVTFTAIDALGRRIVAPFAPLVFEGPAESMAFDGFHEAPEEPANPNVLVTLRDEGGQPVPNASVRLVTLLDPARSFWKRTRRDGTAAFETSARRATIEVSMDDGGSNEHSIDIAEAGLTRVDLIAEGGGIDVLLLAADGRPRLGSRILAFGPSDEARREVPAPFGRGRFRALAPGRWSLMEMSLDRSGRAPKVTVDVKRGEITRASLRREATSTLIGRVVGPEGEPLGGWTIRAVNPEVGSAGEAVSSESGLFSIPFLTRAEHAIEAVCGPSWLRSVQPLRITASGHPRKFTELRGPRPGRVRISVRFDGARAADEVVVTAHGEGTLAPWIRRPVVDGVVELYACGATSARLDVDAAGFSSETVDVSVSEGGLATAAVTLKPGALPISGRVVDAETGAPVRARVEGPLHPGPAVYVGYDGRFEIGVSALERWLFVSSHGYAQAIVAVTPAQFVEVRLERAVPIRLVVTRGGKPVDRATYDFERLIGGEVFSVTRGKVVDGSAAVSTLGAGRYRLTITVEDAPAEKHAVDVDVPAQPLSVVHVSW